MPQNEIKKKRVVTEKQRANLRPIKKGEIRNPEGGRSHNPLKRALANLTNKEYCDAIKLALSGNLKELQAIAQDPDTPALKIGIITCLIEAINKKDWSVFNSITERLVGKPPEEINLNTRNQTELTVINKAKVGQLLEEFHDSI